MAVCYLMTPEAFNRLNQELEELEFKVLPAIIEEVKTTRAQGDLSENAEYHAAKNKQRETNRKIDNLKIFKVNAQVVNCYDFQPADGIKFGANVELVDIDTEKKLKIRLVGDFEADINKGWISISAPLGKAMLGKKVGDSFEVETPNEIKAYDVISINYNK